MTRRFWSTVFPMRTLRTIAAALCALGLSVSAAVAEGDSAPPAIANAKSAPKGLCVLHDVAR